jgi:hypothetical protein
VDVTSLVTERFGAPTTARESRRLERARSRAVDELSGRTVWCAWALGDGRSRAQRLHDGLDWAGADGVRAGWLEVGGADPLRETAEHLEAMLGGRDTPDPGGAERDACADGAGAGESLAGDDVRPGDVVFHDALTVLLSQAVRENGAHAVWHVRIAAPRQAGAAESAMDFLRTYTSAVDAYIVSWTPQAARGAPARELAALLPAVGVMTAKEIGDPQAADDLAWGSLLADVVHADRDERVGGTLHRPRPTIAAR